MSLFSTGEDYDVPVYAKGFRNYKSALNYATDVIAWKITVCKNVYLVCKQFIDELSREQDKDFPFYFDKISAERICAFASTQQHVKGKWASKPLKDRYVKLEPWQQFLFCCVFGWKKKSTKKRRYKEAYVEVPRKNGKSFISAVIGNYMFLCDGEAGAEVFCMATSLHQADEVFKPAKLMLTRNEKLMSKYRVDVKTRKMELNDGSKFEPIVAKPKDGTSPHCAIIDEYHEHKTDALYQSQMTGLGGRDQPLVLVITTAGKDITSPCHELHDRVINEIKLPWDMQDHSLFGLIYSIDEEDDPYTIESLQKANPNYGVSVNDDYLSRQLDTAKKYVALRSDYLTKNLNVWVAQSYAYFDMLTWGELAKPELDINDFKNDIGFLAVDMSAKFDLTVITVCFVRKEADDQKHLYVFQNTYLPEFTVYDTDNPNYRKYQVMLGTDNKNTTSGKLLTVVPGAETDTDYIYAEICILLNKYNNIRECIFDPWQAVSLMVRLKKDRPRMSVVEMGQTAKNLSPGMKEITGAMLNKRIHHDGNEILAWNMQNVESKTDKNGNEFPQNSNPKVNKKDGAVTLIMCASRISMFDPKPRIADMIKSGGGVRF